MRRADMGRVIKGDTIATDSFGAVCVAYFHAKFNTKNRKIKVSRLLRKSTKFKPFIFTMMTMTTMMNIMHRIADAPAIQIAAIVNGNTTAIHVTLSSNVAAKSEVIVIFQRK